MATAKQNTKRRQEQIAQATLALVAEHGLAACNVAAVARRVGLVPSALYRHFRNKDHMLDAAVEVIQSKLLDNVRAVCARQAHAIERLHDLLQQHVQLIKKSRGIPQVIFSPDFYVDRPQRRARVCDGIRQYLAAVADMIREGQATGTIRPGLDAETAAVLFLGLVQPSAVLWNLSSGKFNVARHAEKAWPLFVQILTTG
ncbi:MAG TPA: TetR/AcrR family transcriptional regulator [Kiritimatiellia bacterium]|nr:TetR/AcrR family transcriptional regulator [Kiritimatiellia bacterium]HOE37269.1 TetR/AcrR family transcriptional regulator [Kiritimatiellia bacterium]HOR74646.1 TetR/AcrR family transcriptional regulator [Kiritimatiellia bacterium]HOU59171.1 TetR/AcrR family transcriptional regulator [Kiritimatiellia bacterium]HPK69636.1 TetR/AcrR family transcriptional regulator [Kiritimatiellia bacterium]